MRSALHPVLLALLVVSSGCSDVPTAPPTPTDSPQLAQDIIEQAANSTASCVYSAFRGTYPDATVSWSNLSVSVVQFSSGTDPNSPSYVAELPHPTRSGTATKELPAFQIVKVFLYNPGGRLLADPTCVEIT